MEPRIALNTGTAHAIEQLRNNRLIRPTAIYEGHQRQSYVELDKR